MPDEQTKEQVSPAPALAQPATEQQQALVPITPMREMLTVLKETGDPELFKAFAHDIIEREVAAARFGQDGQLARVFAGSGVFDGINGTTQGVSLAMTKIQLGRSWNMQPADAMEAINFINGRPSVATRYLAAKMQDAGISWDIEWDEESGNCTGCHLHLKRWNADSKKYDPIMGRVNGKEQQAVVSFTKKDADSAMIHEGGKQIRLSDKWNFRSWPSDMYFARCVSRVRVRYAANILSGILTREEAEDSGNDSTPAGVSPGAERAAIASAAKAEEIGKKLEAAKPKPEVSSEANGTTTAMATAGTIQPAANNVVPISAPTAPWLNQELKKQRAGMMAMFSGIAHSVGKYTFEAVLKEHSLPWDELSRNTKPDNPKAWECYQELERREKAKAGTVQETQQRAVPPATGTAPPVMGKELF